MRKLILLFLLFPALLFGQDLLHKHGTLKLADGRIHKWSGAIVFGRNSDIDIAASEDIRLSGGTFAPFADDSSVTIVSASAADDEGSTGATDVTVYGVDSSFARVSEMVSMDGATPVALSNSYRFIHFGIVDTAGTGQTNAGAITLVSPGSITMLTIPAGEGESASGFYPVASDETAFIYGWRFSNFTASADVTGQLFIFNVSGNVWNRKGQIHSRTTATSQPKQDFSDFPLRVNGSALIKTVATTDTDNTDVTVKYVVLVKRD